eukprot:6194789-Pleurochrysis_carterae.AAC.1
MQKVPSIAPALKYRYAARRVELALCTSEGDVDLRRICRRNWWIRVASNAKKTAVNSWSTIRTPATYVPACATVPTVQDGRAVRAHAFTSRHQAEVRMGTKTSWA